MKYPVKLYQAKLKHLDEEVTVLCERIVTKHTEYLCSCVEGVEHTDLCPFTRVRKVSETFFFEGEEISEADIEYLV